MCENLKEIQRSGYRRIEQWNGKIGDWYDVKIYAKCGYCVQCRNEKANNWVVRNWYEAQKWDKISFITLTYKENPYFLIKKDLQKFIKRLRRYLDYHGYKEKLRIFAVGEYGKRTKRSHFHILIYNWTDENAVKIGKSKKDNDIKFSAIIDKCWGLGITTYQEFERHEIPYITLYESAREKESYEYRTTRESLKKLLLKLKSEKQETTLRKAVIKNIEDKIKELEKKKEFFYSMKQFNTWSTAIGFEKFYENFKKHEKTYDFIENIDGKEFPTPTSWVVKLANSGYSVAIEEMKRRSALVASNLDEAIADAEERKLKKKKRDIIKQLKIEDFDL